MADVKGDLTSVTQRGPWLQFIGDLAKPKLAFFFDGAHLLLQDAPAAVVRRIQRVVRLVRSGGHLQTGTTPAPTAPAVPSATHVDAASPVLAWATRTSLSVFTCRSSDFGQIS